MERHFIVQQAFSEMKTDYKGYAKIIDKSKANVNRWVTGSYQITDGELLRLIYHYQFITGKDDTLFMPILKEIFPQYLGNRKNV